MSKTPPPPSVPTRIRWTVMRTYRGIYESLLNLLLGKTRRRLQTYYDPSSEPPLSDGFSNGWSWQWQELLWRQSGSARLFKRYSSGSRGWIDVIVNLIIATLAVGFSAFLGYWAQDREPPASIKAVTILEKTVAPGGIIHVQYELTRKRICHVHIEQVLLDGKRVRVPAPDEDYVTSPGRLGDDIFSVAIQIPPTAHEGIGGYRSIRSYTCNPLQHWFHWPIIIQIPDDASPPLEFEIKR